MDPDEQDRDEQTPAAPRPGRARRRTALVTRSWAASAAVVAAMTVAPAAAGTQDDDTSGDSPGVAAVWFGDPPEE